MIDLPAPELQIDFSRSLKTIRSQLLQQALLSTVRNASLQEIEAEFERLSPKTSHDPRQR